MPLPCYTSQYVMPLPCYTSRVLPVAPPCNCQSFPSTWRGISTRRDVHVTSGKLSIYSKQFHTDLLSGFLPICQNLIQGLSGTFKDPKEPCTVLVSLYNYNNIVNSILLQLLQQLQQQHCELDPKLPRIRHIGEICSCRRKSAEKSLVKSDISQILIKN